MAPIAKTCSKCGETKPVVEFYNNKKSADGLRSCCKACWNAAANARYKANPDKVRAKMAARYKANRDKANAQSAASTRMTKPTKEN